MNDGYGVWALLISLAYFATLGTQVQSNNVYPGVERGGHETGGVA